MFSPGYISGRLNSSLEASTERVRFRTSNFSSSALEIKQLSPIPGDPIPNEAGVLVRCLAALNHVEISC